MRLPVIPSLSTKDGTANKNARLTNMLRERDKAVVRPGVSLVTEHAGEGGGLIPFNSKLISMVGGLAYVDGGYFNLTTGVFTSTTTYATLDPADKSTHLTLSGGNLTVTSDANAAYHSVRASGEYKSSGKWYCECSLTRDVTWSYSGLSLAPSTDSIADGQAPGITSLALDGYTWNWITGAKWHNGAYAAYGSAHFPSDPTVFLSLLFDADAGTLNYWEDGVDKGVAFTGITGGHKPVLTGYREGINTTINFGASAFVYAPPSGYTGWFDTAL